MMRFGYGPMGGGGYLMMCAVMAVVAILVILGIIALVRYIRVSGHAHRLEMPITNPALQILSERYAKGEINDEEYRTKKTELSK